MKIIPVKVQAPLLENSDRGACISSHENKQLRLKMAAISLIHFFSSIASYNNSLNLKIYSIFYTIIH